MHNINKYVYFCSDMFDNNCNVHRPLQYKDLYLTCIVGWLAHSILLSIL